MRLLVVEDEHSLREDIARKLRLSGYEVDACADGEAALEHWQQSGTTLYCWTSTCPRWTECRCCALCAGTTLRPVC